MKVENFYGTQDRNVIFVKDVFVLKLFNVVLNGSFFYYHVFGVYGFALCSRTNIRNICIGMRSVTPSDAQTRRKLTICFTVWLIVI